MSACVYVQPTLCIYIHTYIQTYIRTDTHMYVQLASGFEGIWGLIKILGPFWSPRLKEYGIIQTPKGPIILINPHIKSAPSLPGRGLAEGLCRLARLVAVVVESKEEPCGVLGYRD